MPRPDGGQGRFFHPAHTFEQAYTQLSQGDRVLISTTGERIRATQGVTRDQATPTIVFHGENSRHGNVCRACWGYRVNCYGTRIGQCTEALDRDMSTPARSQSGVAPFSWTPETW